MRRFYRARNLWIALALLVANGLAWLSVRPAHSLPEVAPRLHPEIAAIREKVWSGEAGGETFRIVITDQMASEAVAWFLETHPSAPFSHPQVHFSPDGVTGEGLAHVLGMRIYASGRGTMVLEDGIPVVRIEEMGVAGARVPGALLDVVVAEAQAQFDLAANLPMRFTRLEMGEGTLLVEGVYR